MMEVNAPILGYGTRARSQRARSLLRAAIILVVALISIAAILGGHFLTGRYAERAYFNLSVGDGRTVTERKLRAFSSEPNVDPDYARISTSALAMAEP